MTKERPSGWLKNLTGILVDEERAVLTPLSWIYKTGMKFRNWSFEQGLSRVEKLSVPVVSVGNLTIGGTGKTPVVADLVQWSLDQGISVGVVSRGYKGDFGQVQRVPADPNQAVFCGDEPTMLARRFPEVPIYVHPDRILAGQTLIKDHQVDWILADDAFQHRRLHRDLNLVVFDATVPLKHLRALPAGRAREPVQSLERADFVILTKTNLAQEGLVEQWLQRLGEWVKKEQLILCKYELEGLFSLATSTKIEEQTKVWLVSGIGNPGAFEELIRHSGVQIEGHTVFSDHYAYAKKDVVELRSTVEKSEADFLVTTSKDLTKLRAFPELNEYLVDAKLRLGWGQREELDKELSRLIR